MSSSADHINYAKFTGFNSIAAAVVFAVFYLPLMGWFVKKSFTIPTYVHYVLTLFCTSESNVVQYLFGIDCTHNIYQFALSRL